MSHSDQQHKPHRKPVSGVKFEKKKQKRLKELEGESDGHRDKKKPKLSNALEEAIARNPKAFSVQRVNKYKALAKR